MATGSGAASGTGERVGVYTVPDGEMAAGSTLGGPKACMVIKATGAVEKFYSVDAGEVLLGTLVLHHWDERSGTQLDPLPGSFTIRPALARAPLPAQQRRGGARDAVRAQRRARRRPGRPAGRLLRRRAAQRGARGGAGRHVRVLPVARPPAARHGRRLRRARPRLGGVEPRNESRARPHLRDRPRADGLRVDARPCQGDRAALLRARSRTHRHAAGRPAGRVPLQHHAGARRRRPDRVHADVLDPGPQGGREDAARLSAGGRRRWLARGPTTRRRWAARSS